MKNLTEKELKPHLEALGLKYEYGYVRSYHNDDFECHLKDMGINLVPEQPEITVKSLGRFMAKFGEYPEAEFSDECESWRDGTLVSISESVFLSGYDYQDSEYCQITDPRWAEMGEER